MTAILFVAASRGQQLAADPPDYTYQPDASVYVDQATGSDANPGSTTQPFATLGAAMANLSPTAQLRGVYLAGGQVFPASSISAPNLYMASYGTGQAVIKGDYPVLSNSQHLHFRNLKFVPATTQPNNSGIYSNNGDDITLDYCDVDGFPQFNVCLSGGVTRFRMYRCWIGDAWAGPSSTYDNSGFYTQGVKPDVQCCIFYGNGWRAPFDLTNQDLINAMMYRHGKYNNPGSGGAVSGTDFGNLYLRNAAGGVENRTANSLTQWCVFWDNCNLFDVTACAGWNWDGGEEISHCAFFGNLTRDGPSWGGGIGAESVADNIHDLLFTGNAASMQLNPAISILPVAGESKPAPTTMPATTATITNCRGWWKTGLTIDPSRAATTTVNGWNVQQPVPGQKTPTLYDAVNALWKANVHTEPQLKAWLRSHVGTPQMSQKIYQWLDSQLPKN